MSIADELEDRGVAIMPSRLRSDLKNRLRESLFAAGVPGTRCLLDQAAVALAASEIRERLGTQGVLPRSAIAIQAIAFDKTSSANWKVPWHQDLMFPFASPPDAEGYPLHSEKGGIDFARPPREVLEDLLAVRLHLDDCPDSNGPLRVSPGTHRLGIIASGDVARVVARRGEVRCLAAEGDLLLLKPLLLHASSQAVEPRHRRVLHLVFHSGAPIAAEWHRAI